MERGAAGALREDSRLKGGPCQTRGALQRLAVLLLISLQPRSKLILVYPDAPKPAKPILLNLKAIQPLYHHPFMFGLNFLVVEGRLTRPGNSGRSISESFFMKGLGPISGVS